MFKPLFVSLFLLGCFDSAFATEPKCVYALVDYSGSTTFSTPGGQDAYIRVLNQVVEGLKPGDSIMVAKITSNSEGHFEEIASADFKPLNIFLDSTRKFDRDFKQEKEKLEAEIDRSLGDRNKGLGISPQTDILGALAWAGNFLSGQENSKREKVILLLSDMQEDSDAYNFSRICLTDEKITLILKNESQAHRIPELSLVKVYVSGVSAATKTRTERIECFWRRYFQIAGADLKPNHYAPLLTEENLP